MGLYKLLRGNIYCTLSKIKERSLRAFLIKPLEAFKGSHIKKLLFHNEWNGLNFLGTILVNLM